jgi:predicted MFS family arabinose efflux permease
VDVRAGARETALIAWALFVTMFASNLPAPFYEIYRQRFGLSHFWITLVFAAYPLTLVAGTIVLARVPDRLGRRPALQLGLVASAACSLLFAWAPNVPTLVIARMCAAVAISLATSAGVSALMEVQPPGRTAFAALAATLSLSLSCGVAPLFAGLVGWLAPAPLQTAYVAQALVAAALAFGLVRLPETAPASVRRAPLRPRRLILSPGTLVPFLVASFASGVVWMVASLFVSVVPAFVASFLGVVNLAAQGALPMVVFSISPLAQIAARRLRFERAIAVGLALTAAAIAGILAAVPLHSIAVMVAATIAAGIAQGMGFFGAQALLNAIALPERRSESAAAFYAITYGTIGVSILALGAIAASAGLFAGFAIVGGVVALAALALIVPAVRAGARP